MILFLSLLLSHFALYTSPVEAINLKSILLRTHLPTTVGQAITLYDGDDSIYLLGGDYNRGPFDAGYGSGIYRYNTTGRNVEVLRAHFPHRRCGGGVLTESSDGKIAFACIGSGLAYSSDAQYITDISIIDPYTGVTTVIGHLPPDFKQFATVPISDSECLLFQLVDGSPLRINLQTGSVKRLPQLPVQEGSPILFGAIGVGGKKVMLFFAVKKDDPYQYTVQTALYDWKLEELSAMTSHLSLRGETMVVRPVYDGKNVWLVGAVKHGNNFMVSEAGLVRMTTDGKDYQFCPVKGIEMGYMWTNGAAYVEKRKRIYLLGGYCSGNDCTSDMDTIRYIDISPSTPNCSYTNALVSLSSELYAVISS